MTPSRKVSGVAVVLAAIALLALGEIVALVVQVQAATKSEQRFGQKRRELAAVAAVEPALTSTNADAIEVDLTRAQRALAAMRADLRGHGPAAEKLLARAVPERRADAYFDIATFVEQMRELAQRRGVAVATDERFGFAAYANAGPENELIPAVFRQRCVAQYLIETLCEAQPERLVSIQRERPRLPIDSSASAEAGRRAEADRSSADYFEIDPRVSARVPGFVETTAFRIVFVGPTSTLRQMLNSLAGFQLPLVVRSVEVEPAGEGRSGATHPTDGDAAVGPLIRRVQSKFTVTVEYVDIVEPKEAS